MSKRKEKGLKAAQLKSVNVFSSRVIRFQRKLADQLNSMLNFLGAAGVKVLLYGLCGILAAYFIMLVVRSLN